MNLRKDHSHAFHSTIVNTCVGISACVRVYDSRPQAGTRRWQGWAGAASLRSAPATMYCSFASSHLAALGRSVHVMPQLSAMDVSARTPMKGAAKCDKHCELQNSVNQQGLERTLRFRDIPESMSASVSALALPGTRRRSRVCACALMCS